MHFPLTYHPCGQHVGVGTGVDVAVAVVDVADVVVVDGVTAGDVVVVVVAEVVIVVVAVIVTVPVPGTRSSFAISTPDFVSMNLTVIFPDGSDAKDAPERLGAAINPEPV